MKKVVFEGTLLGIDQDRDEIDLLFLTEKKININSLIRLNNPVRVTIEELPDPKVKAKISSMPEMVPA